MTPVPAPIPGGDSTRPRHRRPSRWLRVLPALTLAAVLTITASTEFTLARDVLALPPAIAWALPVAIDSYVLAALRSGRDVPAAIAVMAGALTAAMGAHLAAPDGQPLPPTIRVLAATGIMTVLVVVAWRVHVLIDDHADDAHDATLAGTAEPRTDTAAATPGTTATAAPVTASVVAVAGGRGVAAPAASPATSASASTRQPAAVAATTSTPRRTLTSSVDRTATSTPSDTKPGLTDAQILADLDGTSPGVRPLMRTYAIGQGRAARLHREATATAQSRTTDPTTTSDQRPDQTTDSNAHQPETEAQKGNPISRTQSERNQHQESEAAIQHDQEKESHPCITDRVGQSRSTDVDEERPATASLSDFARAGER